ncbi:MAG: protease inhibitor I42 family protein [Terricaulis silvestris]
MMRYAALGLLLLAASCAPTTTGASGAETSVAPAVTTTGVPAPTPTDIRVHITEAQHAQIVRVHLNERFAVELVGTPTAGYLWAPAQMPDFLTRAGEAGGNTTQAQSQPGFAGGNHWEVFMFAATRAGTGELVLEQRRPWEKNEPPAQTFRVTIEAR